MFEMIVAGAQTVWLHVDSHPFLWITWQALLQKHYHHTKLVLQCCHSDHLATFIHVSVTNSDVQSWFVAVVTIITIVTIIIIVAFCSYHQYLYFLHMFFCIHTTTISDLLVVCKH